MNIIIFEKINDKIIENEKYKIIYDLIIFLGNNELYRTNLNKELIMPILKKFCNSEIKENIKFEYILNIIDELTRNKKYLEEFIDIKGINLLIDMMNKIDNNFKNVRFILLLFGLIKNIIKDNSEYYSKLRDINLRSIITKIINCTNKLDKRIEFEGKSILFLINMTETKLEKIEEIDFNENDYIKPSVINYFTSGKELKIINQEGEISHMILSLNRDLTKLRINNIYFIETKNIKEIIQGYGSKVFKKIGGIFSSAPKKELCLSIISYDYKENKKEINIVFKNEKEITKWIDNMEILIKYFQNKRLLGKVLINRLPKKDLIQKQNVVKDLYQKQNVVKDLFQKQNTVKDLFQKQNTVKDLFQKQNTVKLDKNIYDNESFKSNHLKKHNYNNKSHSNRYKTSDSIIISNGNGNDSIKEDSTKEKEEEKKKEKGNDILIKLSKYQSF